MRKCVVFLTYVALVIAGCTRNAEIASRDFAGESTAETPATRIGRIYSVDKYDPERDVDTDLHETILQAKASNKRIILEVGGQW